MDPKKVKAMVKKKKALTNVTKICIFPYIGKVL
jgi:hypothetical protein